VVAEAVAAEEAAVALAVAVQVLLAELVVEVWWTR